MFQQKIKPQQINTLDSFNSILNKYLSKARSKSQKERLDAAIKLKKYIEKEARDMKPVVFSQLMNNLIKKVFDLVNSVDADIRLSGVIIIDQLIDVEHLKNEIKITRFANYLRMVLSQSSNNSDKLLLEELAKTLGHLAKAGGTLAADIVQFEVKRAIEYLHNDKEIRRYAGILVIKELAVNTPSFLHTYVEVLLDNIWLAIRDTNIKIRLLGIKALRATLIIIAKRASKMSERYHSLFVNIQHCFRNDSNVASIHGGLLVISEMLDNTGEFMLARFKEICESNIFKYKNNKDILIKETVISLIPKIAKFQPHAFVRNYLNICIDLILNNILNNSSRGILFQAYGDMILAIVSYDENLGYNNINRIFNLLKESLQNKVKYTYVDEAYYCISKLCQAYGNIIINEIKLLLDDMFNNSLTQSLVDALDIMRQSIPSLLSDIESKLYISTINILQDSEIMDSSYILIALKTLALFDFNNHSLLEKINDTILIYIDDENDLIRKQTAITTSKIILRQYKVSTTKF